VSGADAGVRSAYTARADEYTGLFGSIEAVHPEDRHLVEEWVRTLKGPVAIAPGGGLLLGFFESEELLQFPPRGDGRMLLACGENRRPPSGLRFFRCRKPFAKRSGAPSARGDRCPAARLAGRNGPVIQEFPYFVVAVTAPS